MSIISLRLFFMPFGIGSFMPRIGAPGSVGWKRPSGPTRCTRLSMPVICMSCT